MTDLERTVANCRRSESTKRSYLSSIRSFLRVAPAPDDWTVDSVVRWLDELRAGGMAAKSARQYLVGLRFAARRLDLDFADEVEDPSWDDAVMTDDEIRRLLAFDPADLRERRDRAVLALAVGAGWTHATLTARRRRELDLAQLPGAIRPIVRAWTQELRDDDPLVPHLHRSGLSVTPGRSAPITGWGLTKVLRGYRDRIGRPVTSRELRATFRRIAVEAGWRPETIRAYRRGSEVTPGHLAALSARLEPLT